MSAYIPPHLRNQPGVQPRPAQQSASEALEITEKSTRFHRNAGAGFAPRQNHAMSRSFSVPNRMNEITDKEVEALFEQNEENPDFNVYESAKVNVHTKEDVEPITKFPGCGVNNQLLSNLAKIGFKYPTAVQKYSIPYVIHGSDLLVTSQTGSGKTAAFMLPVITQILKGRLPTQPTVVALVPTRELALQIQTETNKFSKGTELKTVCVYGGSPIHDQLRQLRYACHILIATPGRLIDILNRGQLSLADVRYLILDEADRMLDMGFEPQISEVISGFDMPPCEDRQTLLFSATFPKEVQQLARSFMRPDMTRIEVGLQDAPSLIEQRFEYVPDHNKMTALLDAIEQLDGPTLVFAERKVAVDRIEDYLYEEGKAVVAIHGDRDMEDRLAALKGFTSGRAQIMVATDVAARGIDIPNVAHVINLDLPTDLDSYIHRIGRTGRAGHHGVATSFFNESNDAFLHTLVAHFRQSGQKTPDGLEEFERAAKQRRPQRGRGGPRGRFPRDRSYQNMGGRF